MGRRRTSALHQPRSPLEPIDYRIRRDSTKRNAWRLIDRSDALATFRTEEDGEAWIAEYRRVWSLQVYFLHRMPPPRKGAEPCQT